MSASADMTRVETALRKWVELALVGTTAEGHVILGRQGRPRPVRPYATVGVDVVQTRGHDERRDLGADGSRRVVGPRVVLATIQLFGAGALGLAEQVRSSLQLEAVKALLRVDAVSVLGPPDAVQNVATGLETDIEERGAFEARFAYASDQTESLGRIDDVEIAEEYEDPAGTTVLTQTQWVPESPA